ncbi:MAG: asparaginase domain-containing protein [Methylococcales bacterium]|nr:asparaginase domain-containing protein [Methylococcales bacterium]
MKIAVLYTGGTIGCLPDLTGALSPLPYDSFKAAFTTYITPIIQARWPHTWVDVIGFKTMTGPLTSLDSTNLQPHDWCLIATQLLDIYLNYDGFIVLHGTDTMAWTASALSFLFTALDCNGNPIAVLDKPIIVTGSQLPLFEGVNETVNGFNYNTDAYQSIFGSVSSIFSGITESCLFFNRKLLRGNRSIKTNASLFDAFSSPNYPPLAEIGIDFSLNTHPYPLLFPPEIGLSHSNGIPLTHLRNQLTYISNNLNNALILPFSAFPAYYNTTATLNNNYLAEVLNKILEIPQLKGLILESYGAGNFPSGNPDKASDGAIYQALAQANASGITIINCTQVLAGTVNANAYAAGAWMNEVGSVDSYDMISVAALCKLIYLNTLRHYNDNNWNQTLIKTLMQTNMVGEIMPLPV